jgi:hypothetical protein
MPVTAIRLLAYAPLTVTIRIPRRVLYALVVVVLLGGAGVGGYVLGRHSRSGLASQLSRLQRRDASAVADEVVHERDTAQLLINLCREVVRLPVAFGSLDPASCNPGALVYLPTGLQTLVGHNDNLRQGIEAICNMVLHAEGAKAFLDQHREGCLEQYQLLPTQNAPLR